MTKTVLIAGKFQNGAGLSGYVAEHADILQTALDRDPAACAAALRKHFDTHRRFSSRTIDW